jgi:hypothetical protein
MKTCYAISSGSYSDYRVIAIFTTKEMAEDELFRYGSDAFIEDFPLDPITPDQYAGLAGFYCGQRDTQNQSIFTCAEDPLSMMRRDDIGVVHKHGSGAYSAYLWARDKDHAIKVAAEKFAHQRAIDAGIAI